MFSKRLAKFGEFRRLVDQSKGKLAVQSPFDLVHKRDRLERIAAGFEEVVLRAANVRVQYFLPYLRDRPRNGIVVPWPGNIATFNLDIELIHVHQRSQVQLGTGQPWNVVEQIEAPGPHRRWHRAHQLLQVVGQPGGRLIASAHIGYQGDISIGAAGSGHDSDVAHQRMPTQRGFHSFEIDEGAPNLDLPVFAAHPFQQSVGPLTHQISRPEQAGRSDPTSPHPDS